MSGPRVFHFYLAVAGCRAKVRLNGFGLFELDGGAAAVEFAPPVNEFLVGAGNRLEIDVHSTRLRGGGDSKFEDAELGGVLSAFEVGDIFEAGAGDFIVEVCIPDPLKQRQQRHVRDTEAQRRGVPLAATAPVGLPFTMVKTFDTEGSPLREPLVEGEVIAGAEAIVDYGIFLRDLLRNGDVAGLVREFSPKLCAYAAAYGQGEPDHDGMRDLLQDKLIVRGPVTDFEREDLEAVPHCDGRIWTIRRKAVDLADLDVASPEVAKELTAKRPWIGSGEPVPLFVTEADAHASSLSIRVHVARVAGELKIVR